MFYVIQSYETKEAAERAAKRAPQWSHPRILTNWEYDCASHVQDIELVAREILKWEDEQIAQINKEWVIDALMDFNFNDYYAYLEQAILDSMKEEKQIVVVEGSFS